MALQHLRSGTANKRPLPTAMSDGQLAVNTNLASPGLFFKDSNGDIVKVGPVHIGSVAPNASPASTAATALVANTIYKVLTVGTSDFTAVGAGSNAVGVVFTASGTTTGTGTVSGEQGNEKGEMWLDNTGGAYDLKIYDGTAWRSQAGEFVNATGDTMTGDLLFNNANIVFEGSAADDHETTLTVVNPTADRTITLPNVTGTVVTTGDTGTVTSTMLTDGTIVNADVNASAAIAGTKVSPDFGSQAVTTTGIINANGKVSFPLGTAAAPSLLPGSDTNTGIFSPGADSLAIATAGAERFSIAADGTSTFAKNIVVDNSTEKSSLWIKNGPNTGATQGAELNFGNTEGTGSIKYIDVGNKAMLFYVDGVEIVRFKDFNTTSGASVVDLRVGIGETSPQAMLDVKAGAIFVNRSTIGNSDPRIKLEKVVTGTTITGKITADNLVTTSRIDAGTTASPVVNTNAISAISNGADPTIYVNSTGTSTVSIKCMKGIDVEGHVFFTKGAVHQLKIGDAADVSPGGTAGNLGIRSANSIQFFTGDMNEKIRIDNLGRVGIGCSPSVNLDIAVASGTAKQKLGSNSVSGGSYTNYHGASATKTWFVGSNYNVVGALEFWQSTTNGGTTPGSAPAMIIDSLGNVGIGTSSVVAFGPTLQVAGGDPAFIVQDTATPINYFGTNVTSGLVTNWYDDAAAWRIGTATTVSGSAYSEKMRIDSSGNVGIGTISGAVRLNIAGNSAATQAVSISAGSSNPVQLAMKNGYGARQGVVFQNNGSTGYTSFGMISENTALTFKTAAYNIGNTSDLSTDWSEAMRIDGLGRLLIGTQTPGDTSADDITIATTSHTGISIRSGAAHSGGIYFGDGTTGASQYEGIIQYSHSTNALQFYTHYSAGTSTAMTIDSSDRLLLGTTSAYVTDANFQITDDTNAKLVISNPGNATYSLAVGTDNALAVKDEANGLERMRLDISGRLYIGKETAAFATEGAHISQGDGNTNFSTGGGTACTFNRSTNTGTIVSFAYNGSGIGSVSTNGSLVSYNTGSDYRLKENVVDIADGITRVKQLQPRRFSFIADDTTTVDGFIAHEAQTVVPEAVTGEKDGKEMQGIDQSKLVPLLTAALQEAITKIETLEQRLSDAGID